MSKKEYEIVIYEDGVLVMHQIYDDFNKALERYAQEWSCGYHVDLFRHILNDKGNILKAEKFKDSWIELPF